MMSIWQCMPMRFCASDYQPGPRRPKNERGIATVHLDASDPKGIFEAQRPELEEILRQVESGTLFAL
jgi:hypothetical protein